MGRSTSTPVTLRLVHESRGTDAPSLPRADRPFARDAGSGPHAERRDGRVSAARRASVGAENRSATTLTPDDARLITAKLAAEAIEGGRAAIIRPEVRRRLVATATGMGLRPFDANLVIAIVQDDARTGAGPAGLASRVRASISREASSRVALVRPGHQTPSQKRSLRPLSLLLGAAALGVLIATAVARWITGA